MLTGGAAVARGVRTGLVVCGEVLIPSLFCFMALSGFLSLSGYAAALSAPLGPFTTRILKLPREMGAVALLSMIGGYPVGARMVATDLERGRVDAGTAGRMLTFCVNPGPPFLVTAVGLGMFGSRKIGVILLVTQLVSTILVGWIGSLRAPIPRKLAADSTYMEPAPALVLAVSNAVSAILTMCAFTILSAAMLSLLADTGFAARAAAILPVEEQTLTAVFSGLLEVTSGCAAAAKMDGISAVVMTSAAISFSGGSVLMQVMSAFPSGAVSFRPLLLSRLAHGVLSSSMTALACLKFGEPLPVWLASPKATLAATGPKTALVSVCLLAMCAIFSLSLVKSGDRDF